MILKSLRYVYIWPYKLDSTTHARGFLKRSFCCVRHLGRDFSGDASGVVGLGSDEDDARLLELLEEEVDEQEVSQVVNAYSFLKTVRRSSRLLVLEKSARTGIFIQRKRKEKKKTEEKQTETKTENKNKVLLSFINRHKHAVSVLPAPPPLSEN